MSALHTVPGQFELQRTSSFQEPETLKHKYALGEEDNTASQSNIPHESDYEEEVDESVRDDMAKLEDTFPGISVRFRLVNKIGEGMVPCGW